MDDPRGRLDRLARRWTPATSLVPALAPDALLTWIDAAVERGDDAAVRAAVPRLLRLAIGDALDPIPVWEGLDGLTRAGWRRWPLADRAAVEEVLDGWWWASLLGHPSRPAVPDVLVAQARVRGEVRPLLDRWTAELDGPGAVHLAELLRDGLDPGTHRLVHPGWVGSEDLADQVVAWARSEAVILGLTLLGGSHLDRGLLSDALDRMI